MILTVASPAESRAGRGAELQYAVKWKKVYYGLRRRGIQPAAALWNHYRTRYVKVKTLEEAQGPEMQKWIEEAGRVPGWK